MILPEKYNPLFVIISIGTSFVFSILINSILLKFSQTLGTRSVNNQSQIRWNPDVKPSVGGISFFVIFLLTFIIIQFIHSVLPLNYSTLKIAGIFIVCTIAFLMGLADDAYNTQPLLKFVTQLTCGLILYFTDTKIKIFDNEAINLGFTVFWIIGIMNSINMLDNMDGITTSVSIVILCFIAALNINLNTLLTPLSILSLGLFGALCGFLIYNFHPSKMFMGDTGSQFLGCFLGVVGIDYCWNSAFLMGNSWHAESPILQGFLITALVFILPLTDTITVTINRIAKGSSPFVGGKDHTTHHLFFKGVTEKRITLLYVAISFAGLMLALQLIFNYQFLLLTLSLLFCLIIFLILYINTRIKF